ncbi:hypothetical protein [Bosea sp. AAP35]|uniref:hypothetical protein n=1 Tax=Bosea sp. AAP35 TaxID=1523417 RepID=UPI0012E11A17|nr:hypothetical protein [Bosea sp. AAP35]
MIGTIGEKASEVVEASTDFVGDRAKDGTEFVSDRAKDVADAIDYADDLRGRIADEGAEVVEAVVDTGKGIVEGIGDTAQNVADLVGDRAKDVSEGTASAISAIGDAFKEGYEEARGDDEPVNSANDAVSGLAEAIAAAAGAVAGSSGSSSETRTNSSNSSGTSIFDSINDAVEQSAAAVKDAAEQASSAAKDAVDFVSQNSTSSNFFDEAQAAVAIKLAKEEDLSKGLKLSDESQARVDAMVGSSKPKKPEFEPEEKFDLDFSLQGGIAPKPKGAAKDDFPLEIDGVRSGTAARKPKGEQDFNLDFGDISAFVKDDGKGGSFGKNQRAGLDDDFAPRPAIKGGKGSSFQDIAVQKPDLGVDFDNDLPSGSNQNLFG